jgi:hypothetical protein
MSEGKDILQPSEVLEEQEMLIQIPGILRIARNRIKAAKRSKIRRTTNIELFKLDVILNENLNASEVSTTFRLDDMLDYTARRESRLGYVDINLTRFPLPHLDTQEAFTGIGIRIGEAGTGLAMIEFIKKERDGKGGLIDKSPEKNSREAVRQVLTFVASI